MSTVRPLNVADVSNRFFQTITDNGRAYANSPAMLAAENVIAEETQRLGIQAIKRGADAPDSADSRIAALRRSLDPIVSRFEPLIRSAVSPEARARLESEMRDAIQTARQNHRAAMGQA